MFSDLQAEDGVPFTAISGKSIKGLSWLGVEGDGELFVRGDHQPAPTKAEAARAAAQNCSRISSIEPKSLSMASASASLGLPPRPAGVMTFQKISWL